MKFEHLQGSIVAMVTPFRQDGSVNFDMLTELLERQDAARTPRTPAHRVLLGRPTPRRYRRHPDPGHHRRILHDEP